MRGDGSLNREGVASVRETECTKYGMRDKTRTRTERAGRDRPSIRPQPCGEKETTTALLG
ncbi:uncharacterized protein TRAVEDRAFT_27285 [Trametes versicolor FP-101664 SS1]|uniref:uncharacterized protein n=1 Tax=Trametes versicolor (strain FP-101664) TaxID=717944 RepID=UPI00046235D2|nr:uncharacterized protein TRAVEDRAFT_27285 [Trametes versicolor FP-101664 SS1]EIW61815.1 hypothetical protein TRAVEDRAFT_27285 [Trametes versicolor FP-101664 SS1]